MTIFVTMPTASAITIDMEAFGIAGNTADTTSYGAVSTSFQIMTLEFPNAQ